MGARDNVCVVGLQWGDEGKGKIVNLLTDPEGPWGRFGYVVRYGGGANAGHTVVIGGRTFKMHLVPSGIIWPGVIAVIANGVVVDPPVVLKEVESLRAQGVSVGDNLRISRKAHVVMPYHKLQDQLSENRLGRGGIGTTCRGIGPCYADKALRTTAVRVGELLNHEALRTKLGRIIEERKRALEAVYGPVELDANAVWAEYRDYGERLRPFICDSTALLHEAARRGERMLFEGAQGTLLDLDHGTYPYVTSSNSSAGGLFSGTGLPPSFVTRFLGVIKAYSTRVGAGPFPTEQKNDIGQYIRERGREYGTTTGRPRRTGWFDAVAVKYSAMISGATDLAVMLFDVLSGLETVKIAVGYRRNGETLAAFPAETAELEDVEAIYEEFTGWSEDLGAVRSQADLPAAAVAYLRRVQELVGVPVRLVSVGPDKRQTIAVNL